MKKRILSLLCAVAVLATMLSVVTFSASAETPQKAVGEVINISPWNADNWSWSYVDTPTSETSGVRFIRTVSGSKDKERVTYNTAYNFSDGFTVEYTAAADSSSNWIDSAKDLGNDVYFGGFVGNVSFGVWIELVGTDADKADKDRVIYPAIFIGDEVIKGEAECTLENADQAKYYFNKSTKSGYVQDGKYAVSVADYDADTNTLTFTRTSASGTPLSSVSYTDTEGKIDVSNAQAGMRFNTSAKLGEYYKTFTVTGKERTATTPKAMGEVININPYVADKWTANGNCGGVTVDSTNGGVKFTASSGKNDVTLTYNTAYDFSDGFTVTYTSGNGNGNWVNGLLKNDGNGWTAIEVKNEIAEDGLITFTDDNYNLSEQALYSVAFGKQMPLLMGQNPADEIGEKYYTEPVSLAGYHLLEGVSTDVGGLMGRQGKIIDSQISKTEGRTIIGMIADDLINVDSNLVIIGSDGNRNVNITLDCAYTYFYNGSTKIDASGVKIDNDTMAAAFAIVDNDGYGNAISGYGYYRLYNDSADSESNFLFDVLLAAPKAD